MGIPERAFQKGQMAVPRKQRVCEQSALLFFSGQVFRPLCSSSGQSQPLSSFAKKLRSASSHLPSPPSASSLILLLRASFFTVTIFLLLSVLKQPPRSPLLQFAPTSLFASARDLLFLTISSFASLLQSTTATPFLCLHCATSVLLQPPSSFFLLLLCSPPSSLCSRPSRLLILLSAESPSRCLHFSSYFNRASSSSPDREATVKCRRSLCSATPEAVQPCLLSMLLTGIGTPRRKLHQTTVDSLIQTKTQFTNP